LEWNKLTLFEAEGNFTMRNLSLQSSWGPYANNMSDKKGVVAKLSCDADKHPGTHTKVTTKHKKLETRCTHTHAHTHTYIL
jgi:hypothetical protein